MWLKLGLVTSWMLAVVEGWTLGGFIHILAGAVVGMVLAENNDRRAAKLEAPAEPAMRSARPARNPFRIWPSNQRTNAMRLT